MPLIQIDPDDTELKDAIQQAERLLQAYQKADKAFDRFQPSAYKYLGEFETMKAARNDYEYALQRLGYLFMERL